MSKNVHSTDGIAEDLIRSFVQVAAAEMHAKTLLEKRISELENGLIDVEEKDVLANHLKVITKTEKEVIELAQIRRDDMLLLFEMYGSKGDKEKWCSVKHLAIASMTAFEAWQASDRNERLLGLAIRKNALFIRAISAFLGVEITECASCFSDFLKGGN
ncbi:hypothetical protein [Enterococcus sp. DIV0800]|uniref:hypothetical protein n=1 Tax=unclassified Enterococcus TaxID=2608891 RepID=UPI003D3001F4